MTVTPTLQVRKPRHKAVQQTFQSPTSCFMIKLIYDKILTDGLS